MLRNPVNIAPFVADDIEALRTVGIKPFQTIFSGQPAAILAKPKESISVHVIKK